MKHSLPKQCPAQDAMGQKHAKKGEYHPFHAPNGVVLKNRTGRSEPAFTVRIAPKDELNHTMFRVIEQPMVQASPRKQAQKENLCLCPNEYLSYIVHIQG